MSDIKFSFAGVAAAAILLASCGKSENSATPEPSTPACAPQPVAEVSSVEIKPGLTSRTMVSGCGEPAAAGQVAVVHYTGWLMNEEAADKRGNKFDSSRDRNQHFKFPLGGGRVIQGWDLGVAGMLQGEVRELTIAPELAYGSRDLGTIPPNSTLIFEVELAGVEGTPAAPAGTPDAAQ